MPEKVAGTDHSRARGGGEWNSSESTVPPECGKDEPFPTAKVHTVLWSVLGITSSLTDV